MFIFIEKLPAQDALNRSVQVSAKYLTNPSRLEFSWPWDWSEGGYTIYRKAPEATDWGQPIFNLPWGATTFTDNTISNSAVYEYAFYKKEFEQIHWDVAVTPGQTYIFTIENIYGNGLCCNFGHGWYLLQACGDILNGGSDFGFIKKDTLQICDNGNPIETLAITINPDMLANNTWWKLSTLDGQTVDSSGVPGTNLAERPKFGYILAGNDQNQTDKRGSLLLLIDDEYSQPLQNEIAQLVQDLRGDGWKVKTHEVNRNDAVTAVKSLIVNEFQQTADLKMVYLLGHIPVPYSGSFYADGHIESHWGAWPADVYYGDMDGIWTDATVNNTQAVFPRNHNVPGDGKFDQSDIPSEIELAVGRVDLYDMPAFGIGDVELTRRYLNKAHQFKTGQLKVARRGLVDDNLGIALGAPAASGWRNFAPMFTADSVHALDYFSTMKNESYLWSFGGGSGSFTSANDIGTTQDFVNDSLRNIFTLLCGSYFGDWDNSDNFLRAPLASAGWTLTSCWAGNPPFTLHRMAMGEPIGGSLQRTQNATESDYYPGPQLVHTALMGDPSLRLHPVKPPTNLQATTVGQAVNLTWDTSVGESISHYTVSRFDSTQLDFVLLDNQVISTNFHDASPPSGSQTYMVRAVKWETSGSGSYWNLSLGATVSSVDTCQPIDISISAVICEGQSFVFGDSTYTVGGTYYQSLVAASGCDSVVTLTLFVEFSPVIAASGSICEGDTIALFGEVFTQGGNYEFVQISPEGCIQHYSVFLLVFPSYEISLDSNYIPPILINGTSHTDDFTHVFQLKTAQNCDSTVTVNFHPLVNTTQSLLEQKVVVYPNPSAGHFFIENKMPGEPLDIEVWNGVGQQVFYEKSNYHSRMDMDLTHLPSGVYWLKIKGLHGIFSKKLILME